MLIIETKLDVLLLLFIKNDKKTSSKKLNAIL